MDTRGATRVIVLGGTGQFGRTALEQLGRMGIEAVVAARHSAELTMDANDPSALRAALRSGDLVLDAAGPFHARSSALVDAAIEVGFDLVDINDDLAYAEMVIARERAIASAGIRVLSSASTVSALAAAVTQRSGLPSPARITSVLVPAARHTANPGTARSLIRSVGRPVRVWREGRLEQVAGWSEARALPMPWPLQRANGRLFESADAVWLPRAFPTVRDVAMYVDTRVRGLNQLLRLAAQLPPLRAVLERGVGFGTRLARQFGASAGGVGYEICDAGGQSRRFAICGEANSFLAAVAPAVLAVQSILQNRLEERGLVPPQRHVVPAELFGYLERHGVQCVEVL